MTDDSEHIKEIYEFHPCDTPRGMTFYKLSELTDEQQSCLNAHKVNIIRNNQIYLQEHPEVKIITSALLKGILRARPKYHVHQFLSKYLMEIWLDIKKEVDKKTAEREQKLDLQRQRKATIAYLKELYEKEGFEEAEDVEANYLKKIVECKTKHDIEKICKDILEEIIFTMEVKEKHHVHIQVSRSTIESEDQLHLVLNNTTMSDSD